MTRSESYWHVWKWGLAAALFGCATVAIFALQFRSFEHLGLAGEQTAGLGLATWEAPASAKMAPPILQAITAASSGPMTIRTVSLKLTSKTFDDVRAKIDGVIGRSHGYIDKLTIRSDAGLARSVFATLRIPADQLRLALDELKTLGSLVEESETSEDITSGYTDLVARLSNARRTEQRMLDLLNQRVGKLGELVEVETEIGKVREQIEKMEAQQKQLQNQVRFASIQLELTEESHPQSAAVRTAPANRPYRWVPRRDREHDSGNSCNAALWTNRRRVSSLAASHHHFGPETISGANSLTSVLFTFRVKDLFLTHEECNLGIEFNAIGVAAADKAGMLWCQYRSGRSGRDQLIPDFLVGAHALLQADVLLSRDRGFYRRYFKTLKVGDPSKPK